jgi:hypothetical protein
MEDKMIIRAVAFCSALLLVGFFLVPATYANPSWYDDSRGIDMRQQHQGWNISQGVGSGRIDAREAQALYREQARIRDLEARMKSDGALTWRERVSLNRELNQAAVHIYQDRANGWYDRWQGAGWNDTRYDRRYDGRSDKWQDRRNDKPSRSWIH